MLPLPRFGRSWLGRDLPLPAGARRCVRASSTPLCAQALCRCLRAGRSKTWPGLYLAGARQSPACCATPSKLVVRDLGVAVVPAYRLIGEQRGSLPFCHRAWINLTTRHAQQPFARTPRWQQLRLATAKTPDPGSFAFRSPWHEHACGHHQAAASNQHPPQFPNHSRHKSTGRICLAWLRDEPVVVPMTS